MLVNKITIVIIKLKKLSLQSNSLSAFQADIFENLGNLEFLYIDNLNLSFLKDIKNLNNNLKISINLNIKNLWEIL